MAKLQSWELRIETAFAMNFKPSPDQGRWHGIAAIIGLLGRRHPVPHTLLGRAMMASASCWGCSCLLSLPVIGYLGYRTVGAWTLEYWVDRNAITLVWGPTRQVIPLPSIQRVQVGTSARPIDGPGLWHWPCPERRRCRVEGLGMVNAYATCPLSEQVILVTDQECYGLSPADAQDFIHALQERRALGPARFGGKRDPAPAAVDVAALARPRGALPDRRWGCWA